MHVRDNGFPWWLLQPTFAPSDVHGAVDADETAEDAIVDDGPDMFGEGDDLMETAAKTLDKAEADDAADDDEEADTVAKADEDASDDDASDDSSDEDDDETDTNDDAEDDTDEEDKADDKSDDADDTAELPEHLEDWSTEEVAALQALPEEARELLMEPDKFVEQIQEEIGAQIRPFIEQMTPYAEVLGDEVVSEHIDRRAFEWSKKPEEVVQHLVHVDNFLAYTPDLNAKYAFAKQFLEGYGIDVTTLAIGLENDENGPDTEKENLRLQSANASWKAQRAERRAESGNVAQHADLVKNFTDEKDSDGNLLHPLMEVKAVQLAMGTLLRTGEAKTIEEAYETATSGLDERIETRSDKKAEKKAKDTAKAASDRRAKAVSKAKRAAPVKANTNSKGSTNKVRTLEQIAAAAYDDAAA